MVPQQGYPPYPPQYHGAGSYPPVHQQPSAHYPGHGYAPQPVNVVVQNTVGHGMHPQTGLVRVANRQKGVAVVLALFLGGFGVHRFYLGQIGMGVVYLLFFWTFIPAFVAVIEALILLLMSSREFDVKYNSALV